MYVDESGSTSPFSPSNNSSRVAEKHFVLSGCLVTGAELQRLSVLFRDFKKRFFDGQDLELKSNSVRYASPDRPHGSSGPLAEFFPDAHRYQIFQEGLRGLLRGAQVKLLLAVVDKSQTLHSKDYSGPQEAIYQWSYTQLLSSFQKYLEEHDDHGICIADPRQGNVDKGLMRMHDVVRWNESPNWKKCDRIVEKLLFSESSSTLGIQLSDLLGYPIYHHLKYGLGHKGSKTWLSLSRLKLLKPYGVVYFPWNSKKGHPFFG